MNEIIVEGLVEEDLRLLKVVVESYPITLENFELIQKLKTLNDKLTQVLDYLND